MEKMNTITLRMSIVNFTLFIILKSSTPFIDVELYFGAPEGI